ncbi:MAG: SDR family oxidoreductase [Clostridiales bacterium]|nr:SDR family oxidoreductase [Clostridiales bacterium]
MENVKGKVAFITGAASGIGLGIAKAFGEAGMKAVIADLRKSAIDEVIPYFEERGWPVHGIQLNVTDREAYVRAADEAEEVFGKIHILVNNAGVEVPANKVWDIPYEDIDFITEVNFKGVLNGIHTILPRILKHGEEGHVVSTASQSGLSVVPAFAMYNSTKAAIIALMETLACDLMGTNVGASAFCPGPIEGNLRNTSKEVSAMMGLKRENNAPPPPRRVPERGNLLMDPVEAGRRVLRGIRRKDLYIFTHSEFKDVMTKKCNAMLRAYPDQPVNEEFMRLFSILTVNPIYDMQTQVPAPDWK